MTLPARITYLARNEEGFTIMELIVVSVLTLIVLAVVYNIFATGMDNANMIDRNNRASRDVSKNLDLISRYIRSSEGLDGPLKSGDPGDYALCVRNDFDADGQFEYLTFSLDASGSLQMTEEQHTGATVTKTWGENFQNQNLSRPIFTYLDSAGNELTDTTERAARTRSVRIRLVVDNDLTAPPQAFEAQTLVTLRNPQS